MNIWPWTWTNICSLNEHIQYYLEWIYMYSNFPEWICFYWTGISFLERTDKVPWNEYNFVSEYNCLEWLYFLWITICSLNESVFPRQLTSISFPWSWINTIPWSCINIQLLDVKWCLKCKSDILFNLNIRISWILHHLQTANHKQLWMVKQTNTNYDLLVLCVACELRPLVYHEKQRPLVSPRKICVSLRQIRHYHWNLLF